MVYCTKCGANNADDAKVCVQCGTPLYPVRTERESYRRREEECFGIPRGGAVVTLVIGAIIILAGLSFMLSELYPNIPQIPWWPAIIIILGILIIVGAIYRLRRTQ